MGNEEAPLRLLTHYLSSNVAQKSVRAVPTSHPGYEQPTSTSSSSLSSAPFLAQSAAAQLFLDGDDDFSPSSVIVARIVEQGFVLEVILLPCSHSTSLESPRSSSADGSIPQRFLFPAPLLPSVNVCRDPLSHTVYIFALTTTGWLYRLCFSLRGNSVLSVVDAPGWVIEHRIANIASPNNVPSTSDLGGRSPIAVHTVEAGLLLVACKDGTLVKLEQSRETAGRGQYQGPIRESLLRASSFMKTFSHFFSRSSTNSSAPVVALNNRGDDSAPSQVVAMSTYLREDASALAFCLSRDRKLRVWDLVTDVCLRTMDLPRGIGDSLVPEELLPFAQEGPLSPLIKIYTPNADDDADSPLYLMLYIPAPLPSGSFFAFYGIELEGTTSRALTRRRDLPPATGTSSGLGAISLLWQRACAEDTRTPRAELRDLKLARKASDSLTVWSLWDVDGRVLLQSISLSVGEDDELEAVPWTTVAYDTASIYSSLHGAKFDNALQYDSANAEDIADIFLARIMEAGRYSAATISWALQMYAGSSSDTSPPSPAPPTASEIAATVASRIRIPTDPNTGAVLYAQFQDEVRTEWMRFTALLEETDAQGRWPLSFVASPLGNPPLILARDRLLAADLQPLVDTASMYSENHTPQTYLLKALSAFYVASSPSSREGDTRRDDLGPSSLEVIALATFLREAIPEHAMTFLTSQINGLLSVPLERNLLDAASDVYDSILEQDGVQIPPLVRTKLQALAAAKVAVVLRSETIADDVAWEKSALESTLWALSDLVASASSLSCLEDSPLGLTSDFSLGRAFLADGLYQTLRARLSLALSLTVLTLYAMRDDLARSFERLPLLIGRLLGTVHQLSILVKLCDSSGLAEATEVLDYDDTDAAVLAQMRSLKVGQGHVGASGSDTPHSLLHAIVSLEMLPLPASSELANVGASHRKGLPVAASIAAAIASLGLPEICALPLSSFTSIPLQIALLANRLVLHAYPSAALRLVESYPTSAAAQYIAGKALLRLDNLVGEAAVAFEGVIPALLALGQWKIGHSDEQRSARLLQSILPQSVSEKASEDDLLASFYCHISTLFDSVGADSQVSVFADLALESMHRADCTSADLSQLYSRLFRCQLALQRYSDCYATVMSMQDVDPLLRRDSLRTLISAMCEADQVQLLLSFNFSGLQAEVERNLSFKARNCDPRAMRGPNYYHILYSYHVQRGDFTSAGAVMYQQAHRLADLYRSVQSGPDAPEVFVELAVQQARCYLASINALSLLASKDAWFANAVMPKSNHGEASDHGSPRLSSYIPAQHWQPESRELRIVRTEDVRREYDLVLARLELVQLYPELATSKMTLTASDAVALFLRNEQYDKAFSTARSLGVDERGIFSTLALKCATTAHIESECRKLAKRYKALADPDGGESSHDAATQKLLADIDEDQTHDFIARFRNSLSEADIATMSGWSFLQSSARTSSWTGSLATLAWRYLKMNLEVSGSDPALRLVVLNRLLQLSSSEGNRVYVPEWLTGWFEEARPDLLIGSYLRAGLADEAIRCALRSLQKATQRIDSVTDISSISNVAAQQPFISHLLLDALLQFACEAGNHATNDTPALVTALKEGIEQRKMSVLNSKWKEARNWAEHKGMRRVIPESRGAMREAMDWD